MPDATRFQRAGLKSIGYRDQGRKAIPEHREPGPVDTPLPGALPSRPGAGLNGLRVLLVRLQAPSSSPLGRVNGRHPLIDALLGTLPFRRNVVYRSLSMRSRLHRTYAVSTVPFGIGCAWARSDERQPKLNLLTLT